MDIVAEARSPRGELHLGREPDGTLVLRVNGVYVMDSGETTAERLLARAALDGLTTSGATVLVGGLGLGFTLLEVLRNTLVERVIVAEIEPDLVAWHRDGIIASPDPASGAGPLAHPCVEVEVGDVREVVARLPRGSLDVVLLDVDNGPGFLVYDANAAVYAAGFLTACSTALAPNGVLAVWSADPSPALLGAMESVFARVAEREVPVTLGRRAMSYSIYLGHRLP